mmetsp:Transcript_7996/g.10988  ORF Transcript_7996/g.10988 Transcript_7996/m.10988 type:complete len:154 (+) Transcript_7996:1-462(+)
MWGSGSWNRWWSRTTGGHAFLHIPSASASSSSSKGAKKRKKHESEAEFRARAGQWIYTGVAWGDEASVTPNQRRYRVEYLDGSVEMMTRLERPHFIFPGIYEHHGTPTHLVVSAQTGRGIGSTVESSQGAKWIDDKSHTAVLPLISRSETKGK